MNIYAPNDPIDRVKLWEDCVANMEGNHGLLVGDFNMVLRAKDRIPNKSRGYP